MIHYHIIQDEILLTSYWTGLQSQAIPQNGDVPLSIEFVWKISE